MFTKADIEKYFDGEKDESRIFLFIGVTGLLISLFFLLYGTNRFYMRCV